MGLFKKKEKNEKMPIPENKDINGNIITDIKIGNRLYSMEYDPEVGLKVPIVITSDEYIANGLHHGVKYVFYMTIKRDMLIDIFKDILPEVLPDIKIQI